MGRWLPKDAMQERILDAADRLFYGQGIRAVGVDTVAAEIGISKRTLYNYYPSKDALILAYLQRRSVELKASEAPPLEQILGFFDRLERSFASKAFRGCPFVNAVAELGEPAHEATGIAIAFKERRRAWFRDLVMRAGATDADLLSTQLALLVDGAIAGALVRGDPAVARVAKEAARVLLAAAGVPAATASTATAQVLDQAPDERAGDRQPRARKARLDGASASDGRPGEGSSPRTGRAARPVGKP